MGGRGRGGPSPSPAPAHRDRDHDDAWQAALAGLAEVGPEVAGRLRAHWALVSAWDATSNLTGSADPADAAWLHYRDCLMLLAHLGPGSVLDVGSGAGFPGLVLAICRPSQPFCLLEPRRRRASFLTLAAAELGLSRVQVLTCRAEAEPRGRFDQAVTRATFSGPPPAELARWLAPGAPLWALRALEAASWPGGQVVARYHLTPPGGPPRGRRVDRWHPP